MVQPNRIVETIRPVKVSEPSPGVYLVDMGRNFTGWFELRLPAGAAGSSGVKLEYADFPSSGPRLATYNQRDEVIPPRRIGADFRSRFNYHAFSIVRDHGPQPAASASRMHERLLSSTPPTAGRRIRVLQRPLEPDLPDGHLDLPVPDDGRLRGGLPAPRAPGLRGRRGDLARDGHVQLRHRRRFTASGRPTGGPRRTRRPATCPTRPPTTRTRGAAGRCGAASSSRCPGSFTSSTATGGSSRSRIPASRSGSLSRSRRPSITCSSSTRASG